MGSRGCDVKTLAMIGVGLALIVHLDGAGRGFEPPWMHFQILRPNS